MPNVVQPSSVPAASTPDTFSLDRANQLLWRGDQPTRVPPKVFQLLVYLRDNPGRIVNHDELLDAVWPREYVQPEILKTYVKTIRRLLDDDAHQPGYIETRPRCGYRFIGHLPDRPDAAAAYKGRLVGRNAAMTGIQSALSAARAGQRRCLFVVGETGIGKTRLIDEFVARASDEPTTFYRVDCAPAQHAAISFSLARELHKEMSNVTGIEPAFSSSETLCQAIVSAARTRPIVVVIENLQWADASATDIVSRLAYGREPTHLLVVASYRPLIPRDRLCRGWSLMLDLVVHGVAQEVHLDGLDESDVGRLVLLNNTVSLAQDAVEAIDRQAGGNPLIVSALVDQMVAEIRESGHSRLLEMLSIHDYECDFSANVVPEVIRQTLELQLQRLGERARRVLECGSNIGHAFCTWAVAQILQTNPIETDEICRSMAGRDQMLRESGIYVFPDGSVSPVYSFRTRLYSRLLLSGQSYALREQAQQRFTEAVENLWGDDVGTVAIEMTGHFEAVHDWSRALHYAKLAVANAQQRATRGDAASLLRKAMLISERLPMKRRVNERAFFARELSSLS